MRVSLIIPAAGSSLRFRKGVSAKAESAFQKFSNKLLYPLRGKPLLLRTLEAFRSVPEIREMIVATSPDTKKRIQPLLKDAGWSGLRWVRGGKTRAASVLNAIKKSDRRNHWIMVHDGARPFVDAASIKKLIRSAQKNHTDGVILAKRVIPTIKQVSSSERKIEKTLDRHRLYEAETPQLMKRSMIEKAYRSNKDALNMTDEASLMEGIHATVKVVAHEGWNPKITLADDMKLAEAYLGRPAPEIRTGFGRDTHRLVAKRKLIIGGSHIPFRKGALGHSDGDVLLHAIIDGILGVLGAGDIGDWFSDRDPKIKNKASSRMLQAVLAEAERQKWSVSHVDSVIILESPRIGTRKVKIRNHVARLLKVPASCVSIKAKTAEGLGPEGMGLALTCEAVVTMRKEAS